MKIDFLYYEDCPSHEDALMRLYEVLAEENLTAKIHIIRVETDEEAQRHQFVGSPTIRINGQDVGPIVIGTPYSLGCRVYQHDDGRFSPLPSVDMIRNTLHAIVRS